MVQIQVLAQTRSGVDIPDIAGFKTLKCDFHMHTVFSDGKVWPEVRVAEAITEDLDAIAITDHLKFGKLGKYEDIQVENRNRSYDIARQAAEGTDLIVIRGAEITQGMPPGHINAIFLSDANIAKKEYMDTFEEARKQGAFIFWNHPHWKSPDNAFEQNGIPEWYDVHTRMLERGVLMGIEVVNAKSYSAEAHQWCIDKKLTMIANSDIHTPIAMEYDLSHEHRPVTLVFAKEKTKTAIYDALKKQQTALWFENNIIGDTKWLESLFEQSVRVEKTEYLEQLAVVTLKNVSSLDFLVENTGEYDFYNKTNFIEIKAHSTLRLMVKTGQVRDTFQLKWKVKNFITAPGECLNASVTCVKTGIIKDKKEIK